MSRWAMVTCQNNPAPGSVSHGPSASRSPACRHCSAAYLVFF